RLRRSAVLLPVPERAREPAPAGGARRRRSGFADRGVAGDRRPRRSRQGPGRRLLARDAPAPRHRRGAAAQTAPADARRAGHRARPGRDARHARPDPPALGERDDGPALEPPADRGRRSLQPGGDRPLRAGRLPGPARRPARAGGGGLPAADDRGRDRAARGRGPGRDHGGAPRAGRWPHLQRHRSRLGQRPVGVPDRVRSVDRGTEPPPRDARGSLFQPHRGRRRRPRGSRRAGAGAGMNPGVLTVYRWELRKLRAQKRTYLGLGAAAIVPIIFVVALVTQNGQPEDVSFGRYLHSTGLAVPLVLLLFGSVWMFPLITALVAGDIVAAEDRHQTLKTILTRSVERHQIFAGKTLATFTYAIAAIAVTGAVALVAGILASGFNSITTLSGTQVSAGEGLGLVGLSLLFYLVPILAIASIGLL